MYNTLSELLAECDCSEYYDDLKSLGTTLFKLRSAVSLAIKDNEKLTNSRKLKVYSRIISDEIKFIEFLECLNEDYLEQNRPSINLSRSLNQPGESSESLANQSLIQKNAQNDKNEEYDEMENQNQSLLTNENDKQLEDEGDSNSYVKDNVLQNRSENDENISLGSDENNNQSKKRKDRPNNHLHLDDFNDLKLIESISWDENYARVKTEIANTMKFKKIDNFSFNSQELSGILGFICGKYPFFKDKDPEDETGYKRARDKILKCFSNKRGKERKCVKKKMLKDKLSKTTNLDYRF